MSNLISQGQGFTTLIGRFRLQRGLFFGLIIVTALIAFEMFNFSTTNYAFSDLLGGLSFMTISWSTILSIAFCGIDFAGIARLFTPENGQHELNEVWYLFGAWLLAATMNAMLTWWGVSLAILGHETLGNSVIDRRMLLKVVPIFVAVMVWLIRVLIIGTFSVAGKRLFTQNETWQKVERVRNLPVSVAPAPVRSLGSRPAVNSPTPLSANAFRTAPKVAVASDASFARPEPTYHSVSMSAAAGPQPASAPSSRTATQVRS